MSRDTYIVRNSGAVGPNASANNTNISEYYGAQLKSIDLTSLASDLATLKQMMSEDASETEHFEAIAAVSAAEDAARRGEESVVFAKLRAAGVWALDIATKIGVSVAADAIKKSIGIG